MPDHVAGQNAGAGWSIGTKSPICADHIRVEVDQPLPGNQGAAPCWNAMGCVTGGARNACANVIAVLCETCIQHHVVEVMAFGAEIVWIAGSPGSKGRERIVKIDNRAARPPHRPRSEVNLACYVPAFQNVVVPGSMRTIWSSAPELAIIVTVMAIGTVDAGTDWARRCRSRKIPHRAEKARLRLRGRVAHDRVRGGGIVAELENQVQCISAINCTCRKIAVYGW